MRRQATGCPATTRVRRVRSRWTRRPPGPHQLPAQADGHREGRGGGTRGHRRLREPLPARRPQAPAATTRLDEQPNTSEQWNPTPTRRDCRAVNRPTTEPKCRSGPPIEPADRHGRTRLGKSVVGIMTVGLHTDRCQRWCSLQPSRAHAKLLTLTTQTSAILRSAPGIRSGGTAPLRRHRTRTAVVLWRSASCPLQVRRTHGSRRLPYEWGGDCPVIGCPKRAATSPGRRRVSSSLRVQESQHRRPWRPPLGLRRRPTPVERSIRALRPRSQR